MGAQFMGLIVDSSNCDHSVRKVLSVPVEAIQREKERMDKLRASERLAK
jgi:hypothetical protein